jgi:hypothetical protein
MTTFVDIDITDSKRTNGYVHYLIALQNLDPICLDMPISNGHQPLIDEMKRVCNLIEDYLPKCEPHNLREYISSYSMIYTFGKLKQLDSKVLDDLEFRILDAWMDGDKQISDIEAYSIIASHFSEVFDELPQFIDTEDEDLDFKGGMILAPISNEALFQIVDIHYRLLNSGVPYDEFIFTNVLNELEERIKAGDAVAHEIVAHYDDLYKKYNG